MGWIKRKDEEQDEKPVFMFDQADALLNKYDSMIFDEEDEIVVIQKTGPSKEK